MARYMTPTRRVNLTMEDGQDAGSSAIAGLRSAGAGAFPLVGPLASQPQASAENLAKEAALRSQAAQRDFLTGYMGSQIAPMWTPALEAMRGQRIKGEEGETFAPGPTTTTVYSHPAGYTQSGYQQQIAQLGETGQVPEFMRTPGGQQAQFTPSTVESARRNIQQLPIQQRQRALQGLYGAFGGGQ